MGFRGKVVWVCEDHDDCVVIHGGSSCPVCDLQTEHDRLEKENERLGSEVDDP